MEAGKLRRRVTIERPVVSQDGFGGEVVVWEAVATVWAAVEPILGREFVEARLEGGELTTRIRIRKRDDVAHKCRVRHGEDVYEVESVQHVRTENRELVLMCRQVLE